MKFDWSKESKEEYFVKAEKIINEFNREHHSDIKIDRSGFTIYKNMIVRIYIYPIQIQGNSKIINALKKEKWFMQRAIPQKSCQYSVAKSKNEYNMLGVIQMELEPGAFLKLKSKEDAKRGITLGEDDVVAIKEGRKRTLRLVAKELSKQPYTPGEVLYVKEAWAEIMCTECGRTCNSPYGKCYATRVGYIKNSESTKEPTWKQNLHMPKEAAKRYIRIVDIHIEKLRDIDEVGSRLEGFIADVIPTLTEDDPDSLGERYKSARMKFKESWEKGMSTAKRKQVGWYANPWVWVVEFEEI